ncbi:MAG: hypothetical protein MUP71_06690 [Candidatus Aminicenantes bacterium]|nr:hypothetical protein [Candidatus Aminicenantes bacterium]
MKKREKNKNQIPNKFQVPNSNFQNKGAVNAIILRLGYWVIEFWCLFGAWDLEFSSCTGGSRTAPAHFFCLLPLTFSYRVTCHASRVTNHV